MSKPRNGNSQSKKRLGDETGTDSQTKVPKTSDFASKKAAKSGDASESAGSWKLGEFKLGFVGAGVMATAMINGFLDKKIVKASNVIASDPSLASLEAQKAVGVSVTTSNADVVAFADVIILAVKPQVLPMVMSQITGSVTSSQLVISIMAGVTTETIEQGLGGSPRVIRVMPNTPCLIGESAAGLAGGKFATPADIDLVVAMFTALGVVHPVSEYQLDAVTGLSGSGPAYVFMFIEALADGGVRAGLPRAVANSLAAQLVKGAATMVQSTGKHPGELKDQVCSPGGTTIAAVHALEKGGFRGTVMDAVVAAADRSKELRGPASH